MEGELWEMEEKMEEMDQNSKKKKKGQEFMPRSERSNSQTAKIQILCNRQQWWWGEETVNWYLLFSLSHPYQDDQNKAGISG